MGWVQELHKQAFIVNMGL